MSPCRFCDLDHRDAERTRNVGQRGPSRVGLAPLDQAVGGGGYTRLVGDGFLGLAVLFAQLADRFAEGALWSLGWGHAQHVLNYRRPGLVDIYSEI